MEEAPLSMAAPCLEGNLDPSSRMVPLVGGVKEVLVSSSVLLEGVVVSSSSPLEEVQPFNGGVKEALVSGSVLFGAVEVSSSSSLEKDQFFNGNSNFVALDLEKRGGAAALSPSFFSDRKCSMVGGVRSSSSSSNYSDLVKTSKVREEEGPVTMRSNGLGASLTRSGLICLKDQNFEKRPLESDVACTISQQLLDGTGHQTINGRDSSQIAGTPFSFVDREPSQQEIFHAADLSPIGELGHGDESGCRPRGLGEEVGRQGDFDPRPANAPIQPGAGAGAQPKPPASRRSNREAGCAINEKSLFDRASGHPRRGSRFKRSTSGDLRWRRRHHSDLVRFGLAVDLDRGKRSCGGLGGRLGHDGGRADRRRGKGGGKLVWVGSSSLGCTDDDGALNPDRARGRSPPCAVVQGEHRPMRRDRPCSVDDGGRVRSSADGEHGLLANQPPSRTAPLNLQSREGSSRVMVGGEAGQHLGAPELPKLSSWSAVVRGDKEHRRPDSNLKFVPPSMVDGRRSAICSSAALTCNLQRWQSSLVGRVLGRKPYFLHLKKWLERSWRMEAGFKLFSRTEGIFIVKFASEEACIRILESGPWFFEGKLIMLRRWERGGASERALLHKTPLWIRLPLLPLELWNKDDLSRIVSVIGTPLHVDHATATKSRIGYARCCVEVGFADGLPNEIPVTLDEDGIVSFFQDVVYEWIPPRCDLCKVLGHVEGACPAPPSASEKRTLSSSDKQREHRALIAVQSQVMPPLADMNGASPDVGVSVGEADSLISNKLAGPREGSAVLNEREALAHVECAVQADPLVADQVAGSLPSLVHSEPFDDGSVQLPNLELKSGLEGTRPELIHAEVEGAAMDDSADLMVLSHSSSFLGEQVVEGIPAVKVAQPICVEQNLQVFDSATLREEQRCSLVRSDAQLVVQQQTLGPSFEAAGRGDLRSSPSSADSIPSGLPAPSEEMEAEAEDESILSQAAQGVDEAFEADVEGEGNKAGTEDGDLAYLSQGNNVNLNIKKEKLLEARKLNQVVYMALYTSEDPIGEIMTCETLDEVVEFLDIAGAQEIIECVHRLIRLTMLKEEDGEVPPPCACDYCRSISEPFPVGFRIIQNEGIKSLIGHGVIFRDPSAGASPALKKTMEEELIEEISGRESADVEEGKEIPDQQQPLEARGAKEQYDEVLDPLFDWSKVPQIPPCLENFPKHVVCPNPEYEQLVGSKGGGGGKARARDRGKERAESKKKQSQKLSSVASSLSQGRNTRSQGGATVVVPLEDLPP